MNAELLPLNPTMRVREWVLDAIEICMALALCVLCTGT